MHDFLIGSKLNNLLLNRVNIDLPNTNVVTKVGEVTSFKIKNENYISHPAKQFHIASIDGRKWTFGSERNFISINEDDYNLNFNEAIQKLTDSIVEFANGDNIQFNAMYIPNAGMLATNIEIFDNKILIRYLQDYMPTTDSVVSRWDIMITRKPSNAS